MSEFKTYTLEQLCIVGSSKRVHLSDYVQHGVPFYRSKEVIEISSGKNISEQLFISLEKYSEIKSKFPVPQENDVLITAVGTIGEILVVKDPNFYFKDGNLIWLRNINFDIIDVDYLYYFFKSDLFQKTIKYNNIGAVQKALTIDFLKTVKITLPSLDNQRKLISVLKSIDKKLKINTQINKELEAMAKTLYDYWFVQFDFPDQNGKPYKTSGGKMVYNPELKREIPEGWGVTTFSSWISDNKTGDWGKETSQGNYTLEVDCIRGADINGLSGNGKTDMPTRFILEKNKNKLLTDFDIVIEISGGSPTQSTGRIVGISENVLNRFDLPLICSNFCKAVSLKEQETFYNFVYEWKNLYDNGVLFSWEGKTSGIKNLLFDSFVTNYHIAQPPISLMEQFFDYASSVDRKIQLLLKQNQELTQLRDWLLPMLMNGQVII
ncbi:MULTISPECIES: restriction endonuclease subunit S [Streptococcus]|uniref:Type I restriction/modification specificity protein n=1 Tax=Streptococcus viridans TaxID=78535 RepID=A0A3S5DZ77_9STRE|nr:MULTISPECIES: restriction endonuclease subunit S [Streptococcus]VED67488.1 type I restriction/modification specificity protein [Streptococcus viridans]VEE19532.1 type I restriction/modification specificity protein [Streptococcus australis]